MDRNERMRRTRQLCAERDGIEFTPAEMEWYFDRAMSKVRDFLTLYGFKMPADNEEMFQRLAELNPERLTDGS